ncbi:MAG: SDR family NAD(P)-dependent oxidoreductase [Actinomycetes bacterium]
MENFETGSVAFITGAANGIGEGVARRLHAEGFQLALSDVDDEKGQAVAAELGALYVHCDTSDLAENEAAIAATLERFGRLDLAFLNAGISSGCGIDEDFDAHLYKRAMGINIDGVVYGVHAALPALRASGGGQIIATASMAGIVAVPFDPFYGANKHAVVGLVRSLGVTLNPADGIRVNALCPSFAETNIIEAIKPFLEETGFPILPLERVVDAFVTIAESQTSGECYYVVVGRETEPFKFRNAPGALRGLPD